MEHNQDNKRFEILVIDTNHLKDMRDSMAELEDSVGNIESVKALYALTDEQLQKMMSSIIESNKTFIHHVQDLFNDLLYGELQSVACNADED